MPGSNDAITPVHHSDEVPALLERLKGLYDLIDGDAAESENLGRLTDATFDAIRGAGTFLATIPTELGGYEAAPTQLIEIVAELAYANPSAAWATMTVLMSTGTTAAYQPRSSTDLLFGRPDHALFAGQGNKMGRAVEVEGGYRLTGDWSFASGIKHASHVHTGGMVESTGEKRIFSFPKEQATFHENWDVIGLRATGSIDYSCEDLFVPADFTYPIASREPHAGGGFYRIGLGNLASIFHGGWALGVGRRALDELRNFVTENDAVKPYFATGALYSAFAAAEADVRAARALHLDVWGQAQEHLDSNQHLTPLHETLARLSLVNATSAAQEATALMYKWCSSAALRSGNLQRLYRDVSTGAQHISTGPGVAEKSGEMLLAGAATGSRKWAFGSLVPNND